MALAANEVRKQGFIRDTVTGALAVTTVSSGVTSAGGFKRDADGRLLVVYI